MLGLKNQNGSSLSFCNFPMKVCGHFKFSLLSYYIIMHTPLIIREVLVLTLSTFIALHWGYIPWYSLATRMILILILNFKDHIIQFTSRSLGSVLGNTALGTVFLDDADRHNVDILCRYYHSISSLLQVNIPVQCDY